MDNDGNIQYETDDKATARWRWFARRSVILPIVAVLLVGLCTWIFFQVKESNDKKTSNLQSAIDASDAAFQTGDYNKQLNALKGATDDAKTKKEKVDLYSNLAAAAANAGKMDEAVSYLEKKHEIDPSSVKEDAYLVGSYYESIGQNDKALQQYKIALAYKESLPKNTVNTGDIQSLKARIQSLEGGQ
jgi:tetratricopeptide (TPR) repeat protein